MYPDAGVKDSRGVFGTEWHFRDTLGHPSIRNVSDFGIGVERGAMKMEDGSELVTRRSEHSVDRTVAFLTALLDTKGITLFTLIDHRGEAAKVGMAMPSNKLLIFGDPKAGTPLMLASPASAIDLPLKILVRQDFDGSTAIPYNSAAYLGARHGLPEELLKKIAGLEALVNKAAEVNERTGATVKKVAEEIRGYSYGTAVVPASPVSLDELEQLKVSAGFTTKDEAFLRMAGEVLADQTKLIVAHWRSGIIRQHS